MKKYGASMKKYGKIVVIFLIVCALFGFFERGNLTKLLANNGLKSNAVRNTVALNNKSKTVSNELENETQKTEQNTAQNAAQASQEAAANKTETAKSSEAQKTEQSAQNTSEQNKPQIIKPAPAPASSTQSNKEVKIDNSVPQVVVPVNTQSQQTEQTSNVVQAEQNLSNYSFTANNYNEYYNCVKTALENFNDSILIKLNNYDNNTYNLNVIDNILDDYYDIDYGIDGASGTIYTKGNDKVIKINFEYSLSKSQMIAMRDASKAKASAVVSSVISSGMSDLEKELAIHNYVVNNTAYDYTNYVNGTLPEQSFTDYGVLITGKAVCEGYAKAMFRLMSLAGLDCKVVKGLGDGQAHAWNIVKINGSYCQVDATWDDPVTTNGQNILSYDYFDLSDSQMSKDHQWDTSKYPSCTTTQYNKKQ